MIMVDFSTLLGELRAVWELAWPRDCYHVAASGWQSFGRKGDIETECELDLAVQVQQQGTAQGGFKLLI